MRTLLQDMRYGLRMLLKNPLFTFAAVVALALGVGANTAIYSVVNAVLSPLPYAGSDRLVEVNSTNVKRGHAQVSASYPDFADWREQSQSFEGMAAVRFQSFNLTGGAEPELVPGLYVTANLFQMLGVNPAHGRTFTPDDDRPGGAGAVVISHALWQRKFGGNQSAINSPLTLDGQSYSVVGIMPPGFQFPQGDTERRDLYVPVGRIPERDLQNRSRHFLGVLGKLKPGVSIEGAQAEMATIAARLEQQYPETNAGYGVRLVHYYEELVGDVRRPLFILLAAVGFVLLIACANVANLLLARASAREKEIAIRTSLGAGRGRLVRQLLTESVLLALIGGAAGLLLAKLGTEFLVANTPRGSIPRLDEVGLDLRVLLFTLLVSLLAGVVFGLAPALKAARPNLNETLKEGGRGSSETAGGRRFRRVLLVVQTALAMVLLVGAGLLIRSFVSLRRVSPGFETQNALAATIALPPAKYKEPRQRAAFFQQLQQALASTPGVVAVGAASELPLIGRDTYENVFIEGRPAQSRADAPQAGGQVVSPGYFQAMKVPVLKGRVFTEQDTHESPPVLVVNRAMAEKFWPGEDPLGKRLSAAGPEGPWMTVVGVVGDVRYRGLNTEPRVEMYASYLQLAVPAMTVVVRTAGDPASVTGALRSQVWSIDKDQPISKITTLEAALADSIARERFTMQLLSIFAVVALILAAVGIYGVVAHSVVQRTHEIGIRMALGAKRKSILRLIVRQEMFAIVVGVLLGAVAALALTRVMSSILFGIGAGDPITFVVITLVLVGVALLACVIPARRATRVDPMIALRYE